jgi:hypothetical protein
MPFLTLADARKRLWKYAPGADGTAVPYESRTDADELAVDNVLNQVVERFLTLGKWRGDTVRARFKVYNETITLPSTLLCVLGATPIRDVDADEDSQGISPYAIYSEYHEFLNSGPGNNAEIRGLIDLGDGFPTFIDPSGTFYIRSTSTRSETTKSILIKGLDDSSKQIYTAGVEGVSLTVDDSANTTPQIFTKIASWQKSVATEGVVRLYAVDTETAEENLIVIIPPGKLTSGYHRYRVPDGDWGDTVECLCKRAYVPAVEDTDPIIPANLGALKLGMMSLQFEDRNDPANADAYMARAVNILNAELDQFRGDSVLPSVQFRPEFGAGMIPNLM